MKSQMIIIPGLVPLDNKLELDWKKDLIYYDGPVLSIVESNQQQHLMLWFDYDAVCNRWLIFPITQQLLDSYISNQITLLQVIEQYQDVRLVDINNNLDVVHVFEVPLINIGKQYLPTSDSYYDNAFSGQEEQHVEDGMANP